MGVVAVLGLVTLRLLVTAKDVEGEPRAPRTSLLALALARLAVALLLLVLKLGVLVLVLVLVLLVLVLVLLVLGLLRLLGSLGRLGALGMAGDNMDSGVNVTSDSLEGDLARDVERALDGARGGDVHVLGHEGWELDVASGLDREAAETNIGSRGGELESDLVVGGDGKRGNALGVDREHNVDNVARRIGSGVHIEPVVVARDELDGSGGGEVVASPSRLDDEVRLLLALGAGNDDTAVLGINKVDVERAAVVEEEGGVGRLERSSIGGLRNNRRLVDRSDGSGLRRS